MRIIIPIIWALMIHSFAQALDLKRARYWTSVTGSKFHAYVQSVNSKVQTVKLKGTDGRLLEVPIKSLAESDQFLLKNWWKPQGTKDSSSESVAGQKTTPQNPTPVASIRGVSGNLVQLPSLPSKEEITVDLGIPNVPQKENPHASPNIAIPPKNALPPTNAPLPVTKKVGMEDSPKISQTFPSSPSERVVVTKVSSNEQTHPSSQQPSSTNTPLMGSTEFSSLKDALAATAKSIHIQIAHKGIRNLAISKIYFNGSGSDPFAKYLQRKFIGNILETAPPELNVMERDDLRLLVKENTLQWLVSSSTENIANESEALLLGEFLYDKAFRQALFSIRVINTRKANIIAAFTATIELDEEMRNRIGFSLGTPPTASLYEINPSLIENTNFIDRLSRAGSLSLSPVSKVPPNYQFPVRIFYCKMISEFVQRGFPLLERELLYHIADEQTLGSQSIDLFTMGDSILQTIVDESSPETQPTIFIRAVSRDGGVLVTQNEFTLKAQALGAGNKVKTQDGVTIIGSDDSLESAVRSYKDKISLEDQSLVYKSKFILSPKMEFKYDSDFCKSMGYAYYPECCALDGRSIFGDAGYDRNEVVSINGVEQFDWYLPRIIDLEKGNVEAVKADLVALSLFGFRTNTEYGKLYPGPIQLIYHKVSQNLTIFHKREKSYKAFWYGMQTFMENLHGMLHPNSENYQKKKDPFNGTFTYTYKGLETDYKYLDIKFNYSIEVVWEGKFPVQTELIIDFSPMKEKLYKVRK